MRVLMISKLLISKFNKKFKKYKINCNQLKINKQNKIFRLLNKINLNKNDLLLKILIKLQVFIKNQQKKVAILINFQKKQYNPNATFSQKFFQINKLSIIIIKVLHHLNLRNFKLVLKIRNN